MNNLGLIVAAILSYFIGNFSTGAFIASRIKGIDIRKHGSGSAGATNVLRVMDRRAALLTFIGDIAKGLLTAGVGYLLAGRNGAMLCGILAVLGHIWPVLMGFRGGKGVATSFGVLLIVTPLQVPLIAVVAIACIAVTRYVSLGDVLAAAAYAVAICPWALMQREYGLFAFALVLSAVVIFAHRENLRRLAQGKENRLDVSRLKGKVKSSM